MNKSEEKQTQPVNGRQRLLFIVLLVLTFGFGTLIITQFTNFVPSKIVTTPPKPTEQAKQSFTSSSKLKEKEDEKQSSSQAPVSSAKSSTSSSQVATPNVPNSQILVGKTLPEAIAWAQQNHRSYAWRVNGQASDQNVVLSVQDDGTNLSLIVGPKS